MARYPFLKSMLINYLLEHGELTGYDFIKYSRSIGVTASPGSVYPHLKDLESEGIISHQLQGKRKVYTLTKSGTRQVSAWPVARVPTFLKISFFRSLGLAATINWSEPAEVETLVANLQDGIDRLQHLVEELKSAQT